MTHWCYHCGWFQSEMSERSVLCRSVVVVGVRFIYHVMRVDGQDVTRGWLHLGNLITWMGQSVKFVWWRRQHLEATYLIHTDTHTLSNPRQRLPKRAHSESLSRDQSYWSSLSNIFEKSLPFWNNILYIYLNSNNSTTLLVHYGSTVLFLIQKKSFHWADPQYCSMKTVKMVVTEVKNNSQMILLLSCVNVGDHSICQHNLGCHLSHICSGLSSTRPYIWL